MGGMTSQRGSARLTIDFGELYALQNLRNEIAGKCKQKSLQLSKEELQHAKYIPGNGFHKIQDMLLNESFSTKEWKESIGKMIVSHRNYSNKEKAPCKRWFIWKGNKDKIASETSYIRLRIEPNQTGASLFIDVQFYRRSLYNWSLEKKEIKHWVIENATVEEAWAQCYLYLAPFAYKALTLYPKETFGKIQDIQYPLPSLASLVEKELLLLPI